MNRKLLILAILTASCIPAIAADWEQMKQNPAQIEVINMQPTPLVASDDKKGWATVPSQLTKYGAIIYMPSGGTDGIADIKVTGDGFLMLACNYDYQGNSSGKWVKEVWDETKFKTSGWRLMTKSELGGLLVKGNDNHDHVLFVKQVHKGNTFRLRCNKYDPPFPILLSAK